MLRLAPSLRRLYAPPWSVGCFSSLGRQPHLQRGHRRRRMSLVMVVEVTVDGQSGFEVAVDLLRPGVELHIPVDPHVREVVVGMSSRRPSQRM